MTALSAQEIRPGIRFEDAVMLDSDYDDTQFMTSEPAPEGIGVDQAYEHSIIRVLGAGKAAVEEYRKQGGHMGRTAAEIVSDLVYFCNSDQINEIHELKKTGHSNEEILGRLDDRPKQDISQGLVCMGEVTARSVTEVFVAAKLSLLTRQIGRLIEDGSQTYWPRPSAGFLGFSRNLTRARQEGAPINTGIISAGHAEFISKTYELYDLELPDIMITDEVVQGLSPHISAERRSKPAPLPMILAKKAWLGMYDEPVSALRDPEQTVNINSRILYVGDNLAKDGGLANSGHVGFVHIDPERQAQSWQEVGHRLSAGPLAVRGLVL